MISPKLVTRTFATIHPLPPPLAQGEAPPFPNTLNPEPKKYHFKPKTPKPLRPKTRQTATPPHSLISCDKNPFAPSREHAKVTTDDNHNATIRNTTTASATLDAILSPFYNNG